MKITKILCLTATAVLVTMHTRGEERAFDPVEYANPLIGTQSTYELSTGNTYPDAPDRQNGKRLDLCLHGR